jgi:hypothetical protein
VHSIPIVALTRGFPLAPFGWFGTRRPFPCLKGPSCDPEVRHGGQCRPTMFTKQVSPPADGLIPHRGRRGGAGRANSKKDLVTGPIRGFCALQARYLGR